MSDGNLQRNLAMDFLVNLVASFFVWGLALLFTSMMWLAILLSFVTFITITVIFIFWKWGRRLKVLRSGAQGYYFTFPTDENRRVWKQAQTSFKYLGISGDSIGLREFKQWVDSLKYTSPLTFSFLLMDPEGIALPKQRAHQMGRPIDDPQVQEDVEADRKRIASSIELLKTCQVYKASKLMIRLYDEFVPWWMYIFNDEEVFLGVLPQGSPGMEAPVMIFKKHQHYPSLFDTFEKTWQTMWEKAKDA